MRTRSTERGIALRRKTKPSNSRPASAAPGGSTALTGANWVRTDSNHDDAAGAGTTGRLVRPCGGEAGAPPPVVARGSGRSRRATGDGATAAGSTPTRWWATAAASTENGLGGAVIVLG